MKDTLKILLVCMFVCVCVHTHLPTNESSYLPWCVCRCPRTTFGITFIFHLVEDRTLWHSPPYTLRQLALKIPEVSFSASHFTVGVLGPQTCISVPGLMCCWRLEHISTHLSFKLYPMSHYPRLNIVYEHLISANIQMHTYQG